jgi:hypothetical protein
MPARTCRTYVVRCMRGHGVHGPSSPFPHDRATRTTGKMTLPTPHAGTGRWHEDRTHPGVTLTPKTMATRNENNPNRNTPDTTRSTDQKNPANKGEQNPTGSTTRPDPNAERTGTRTDLREDRNTREDRDQREEDRTRK